MTKINKLVMHGFKSFARRTELVFGDKFNCVLGPNGSGKSNILDALCFVLGRLGSKSLRAEKTANLVYNGGKTKKPMKEGEVSIYFDNSKNTFPVEGPEVKISRIIKDDGQSIYMINDDKCTRQQIIDLLSVSKIDPEGYNIILQGDIVHFTEMPLVERRQLIEEIAGISVYEDKKQKALSELEKVDARLREAGVILAERRKYLEELKNERDQAMKFKELEVKIKENKASIIYLQIQAKEADRAKLEEKMAERKSKLDEFNNKISQVKQLIESKKKGIEAINKEIEEKGEKAQVTIQKEIESLKVEIATNKTKLTGLRGEVDRIDLRKKELEGELSEIDEQIADLKSKGKEAEATKKEMSTELKKISARIQKFKSENSIDDFTEIEKKIEEIDREVELKQKDIEVLRQKQQDIIRKKDALEYQINTIDGNIEKVKQIEIEHHDQIVKLKEMKEELKRALAQLSKCLNEDSTFAVQIGDKKRLLNSVQEELAKLQARNASIKEQAARSLAVQSILDRKEKGVYGTVASLGNVSSKYALALEVAAGPRINSLVVEDDRVAAECIKYLKRNRLGTATFLPLNKIKPRDEEGEFDDILDNDGVHGYAIELVNFDKKFSKIFSYVFGKTVVVDDIDTARKLGIGKARMVTIDGDMAEHSGAMQGGFRKAKEGVGFKEKEVVKGIEDKTAEMHELSETISVFEKKRAENEEDITKLRSRRAELEGEIIKGEKSLHLDLGEIDSSEKVKDDLKKQQEDTDKEMAKVDDQIVEVNTVMAQLKTDKQQLRERMSLINNPSVLAELASFQEREVKLKEEIMQLDSDIKNYEQQVSTIKLPEKEKIAGILKQQDKERGDFKAKISELITKVKADEEELSVKEASAKDFYAKYRELFTNRSRFEDEIGKEEHKIEGMREDSKAVEMKINEFTIGNAEILGKLAGLQEEMKQYEGVKVITDKPENELREELSKYERNVIEIGSVNMRALEVYDAAEQEYQTLLGKKEKLGSEKEEVMKMMDEIESRKKELFMESFDFINENFQRIFSLLSNKGEGSLVLENEENPFEGGLDIKVRITGRKFLDIRSLSGGEKTMTALAFIFAIQEYDPHSFYILDEVDAALDKQNSATLAQMIKQHVDRAQYIVISHNDNLISEADILYGISMDEHGVSKVTSLKI
jgi:chromosome segregation protein